MALTVSREANGNLTAVMTSLDQGNAKIPATVAVHGDTLVLTMAMAHASYRAVVVGDSLHGSFVQGPALPLNMGRVAAIPALVRPQEPKPPFPYDADEVSFESVPGVRLSGTLTIPQGAGAFPAIVLVSGSGPQNRNEELLGHKPFLVIADYLARHGIATLRYDDRGTSQSTGDFANATTADFANDAEAAVRFLSRQPRIAHDQIGVIGHSEGGLIAPIVATHSSNVAFIVLLAGPGVPGDSLLLLQQAAIAKASGAPPAIIERGAEVNRTLFAILKSTPDSANAAAQNAPTAEKIVAALPAAEQAIAKRQLAQGESDLMRPWMRYFVRYDPAPTLRKVRVPVLALNGTLDLQVPYAQNLAGDLDQNWLGR
jgi:Dienelactone hydrolase and related enzymes